MKNPLRFQVTEYDCGTVALQNALSYLFEREDIPAELIKFISLYTLDCYDVDGHSGQGGTSIEAMNMICRSINDYSIKNDIGINCIHYNKEDVTLDKIKECIKRNGCVLLRTYLEGDHYVLITDIDDDYVYMWDSYYLDEKYYDDVKDVVIELNEAFKYNRKVSTGRFISSDVIDFSLGPIEKRECTLFYRKYNNQVESIRETYNREEMVKTYSNAVDKVGLWDSEKIMVEKYLSKASKILDLGCGAGRTTINLYKEGYKDIVGLDISDKFISFAKDYCRNNNLSIEFIHGDATKLDFAKDSSYDAVIFSYNGMQCIPGKKNRDNVLKEVYRVLKSGGVYIFTAHNRDDSGIYQYIWDEELEKWNKGTQDKDLEIYGDKYSINNSNGERVFLHFANIQEMKDFVHQEDFEILEIIKREEVCEEREEVKEFSGSTWFWVIRKK